MKKKIISTCILLSFIFIFVSCNYKNNSNQDKSDKLQVVVSFNPLREIAEFIGKDKVKIKVAIPDAIEPHDFEPTAKDLMLLSHSNVFIYNGLGMESWVDKVLESIDNNKIIITNASKGCTSIRNKKQESDNKYSQYDPHIWLGLTTVKIEAKNIMDTFIKADSKNKDFYEKNYKEFSSQIDNLHNEYKNKFKTVKNKNFVTGHAAFAYLCRDFDLNQNSVEGVFSEGEPSAKRIKELIEYCKKNNVKTIFVEDKASPKVSETLAKEVNAKLQKISTLEYKEANQNYITIMKDNLEKIYISLK